MSNETTTKNKFQEVYNGVLADLDIESEKNERKENARVKLAKTLVSYGADGMASLLRRCSFSQAATRNGEAIAERVVDAPLLCGALYSAELAGLIDRNRNLPPEWQFAREVIGMLRRLVVASRQRELDASQKTSKNARKAIWLAFCESAGIPSKVESAPTKVEPAFIDLMEMLAGL